MTQFLDIKDVSSGENRIISDSLSSTSDHSVYDIKHELKTVSPMNSPHKLEVNKGMLMENLVAQMFRANGRKLYYYSSYDKANASNRMEVDFLITKNSITNRHNICPVEVKSTDRYTFTSIRKYISKFSEYTGTPYILHTRDVEMKDGFIFLPLYMAGLL